LLRTLKHKDEVWAAQFSPNDRLLATASQDQTAQLWNVETGARVGQPLMHVRAVVRLSFSPDGRFLGTGDGVGNEALLDVATGQRKFETMGDGNGEANFSPDGRRFFVCRGEELRVFDTGTLKQLSYSPLHLAGLRSADFSPDSRTIVAAGNGF